jgi:hypothetical protein
MMLFCPILPAQSSHRNSPTLYRSPIPPQAPGIDGTRPHRKTGSSNSSADNCRISSMAPADQSSPSPQFQNRNDDIA